jgi:hypothetical protein
MSFFWGGGEVFSLPFIFQYSKNLKPCKILSISGDGLEKIKIAGKLGLM